MTAWAVLCANQLIAPGFILMGTHRRQSGATDAPWSAGDFSDEAFRAQPLRAVSDALAWLGRASLVASLLAAPWAFGGGRYEHQVWLFAGVLLSLALWVVSFVLQPRELRVMQVVVPTLLIPLAGALLLGAIQLVRGLPQQVPWLERYSAAETGGDETVSLPGRLGTPLGADLAKRSQFSIFPASTRLELVRLTAGVAAFLAGLGLFAVPRTQRLLLGALALNGACLACFGIVQKLSWNEMLYWTVPLTQGGQPFASFVNRNNAAGYLNLCLAAAVAWLAWSLTRSVFRTAPGLSEGAAPVLRPTFPPRGRILETTQFIAGLLCLVIAAGIGASASRGGVLSAVLGGLAVVLLLAMRRGVRTAAWSAGAGIVLCAGLLGWLGLMDGISERFEEKVSSSARWGNWQDAFRATRDFPVLGTGFGTYRYAYQPYQTKPTTLWFYNADNHYVEGLTEGGVIGLALIASCVGLVSRAAWLLARRQAPGGGEALTYLALFACVSQFVHAGFDFGISMPANLLTFAVLCGLVVAEASRRSVPQRPPVWVALPVWRPSLVLSVISVVLIGIGWLGIGEIARAEAGRSARHNMPRLAALNSMSPTKLDARIERLSEALRLRPDDAEAHQALGTLLIFRYRTHVYEDWRQRAASDPTNVPQPDWEATGLPVLHRYSNVAFRDGQIQVIDELREQALIRDHLRPALLHLQAAQASCPLIPNTDFDAAMLAFLDDGDPAGTRHIERGAALAPADENQLFTAGFLADQAARDDLSEEYWRRSLLAGKKHRKEILDHAMTRLSLEEAVDRIFPHRPDVLLDLARTRFAGTSQAAEREVLVKKATALMKTAESDYSEAERLYWDGIAERISGNADRGLELLQQAVNRSPDLVDWRLELAEAYRSAGRFDEALEEIRTCLWMAPDHPAIETLRRELVHERLTKPNVQRSIPGAPPGSPPTSSERKSSTGAEAEEDGYQP